MRCGGAGSWTSRMTRVMDAWTRGLGRAGTLAARVWNPQRRTSRRAFARELAVWMVFGLAGWLSLDPIADAEWISDEALIEIAKFFSIVAELWVFAFFALAARRAHDLGLSGAWAFLGCAAVTLPLMVVLGLLLPGRTAGCRWPAVG